MWGRVMTRMKKSKASSDQPRNPANTAGKAPWGEEEGTSISGDINNAECRLPNRSRRRGVVLRIGLEGRGAGDPFIPQPEARSGTPHRAEAVGRDALISLRVKFGDSDFTFL